MAEKIQIAVRVDAEELEALERLGAELKPVPANRSQMINVAIREYLERNAKQATPKSK